MPCHQVVTAGDLETGWPSARVPMPRPARRRTSLAALVAPCLAVALAAPVTAQETAAGSPHGDLSIACEACHTPATWAPLREPLDFAHAATGFALEGAHAPPPCGSCHADLVFAHVPTACADCHADPHRGELGVECSSCHAPVTWENRATIFEVHDRSLFPLTGVHAVTDCEACHRGVPPFEFEATPLDCVACHQAAFEATNEPDHVAAGFPTSCELCHDTVTFDEASFAAGVGFDHDAFFPLIGSHRPLDCSSCHSQGFAGTPTDCFSCHRDDYEGTTDPDHQAAGFPTDCEACHGTTQWEGAEFDHDGLFFPIYSGRHAGVWDDCADCHVASGDFGRFECLTCHEHDEPDMDDEHEDVPGYAYQSQACLECHPHGEE